MGPKEENDYHVIPISSEIEYEDRFLISSKEGLSGAKSLLEKDSVAVVMNAEDRNRAILYSDGLSESERDKVDQTLEDYLIENNLSPLYDVTSGNIREEIEDIWTSVHGQMNYPLKPTEKTP